MKKFCPVYSYKDSVFAVTKDKENTARVNNEFSLKGLFVFLDCTMERF